MRMRSLGWLLGLAATLVVGSASAADLRIGLSTEHDSLDPHFNSTLINAQIERHMFDHLVRRTPTLKLEPELATSWKLVDDQTWELKLREGVKWHDGSPFTADDVIFTFQRAGIVPNSPGSYRMYTAGKEVSKIDDHTIRIKSPAANPMLIQDLERVPIVSKKYGEGATTADYNSGKAMIGTGPYKFVEWVKGDHLTLEKNPNYWKGAPTWDRLIFKPIVSNPSRVAALLAGDVDIIDKVPTVDMPNLRKNQDIKIWQAPSNRLVFIDVDSSRDISPFVFDNDGKPLFPNPLRDWRVRKAMSKAIDRNAIRDRVMDGLSVPTGQIVPEGFFAWVPDLKVEPYDPEGAKKLLAAAGYPNGFKITMHGSNNRYVNDGKIVEAVAQMFTRVGIKTEVNVAPANIYFAEAQKLKYSVVLFGYGLHTGGPELPMTGFLQTFNPQAGTGEFNRGRYSNARVDALASEALTIMDDAKREAAFQEAQRIFINDVAKIPLHYEVNIWATRKGFKYDARYDEQTLAMGITADK
jgi:peptide/nickel transport system substrate-binding protein